MIKKNTIDCLGYPLYNQTLDQLPKGEQTLIGTINQYSFCIAEKDAQFKRALIESDVLLPDGVGMVIAAKIFNNVKVKKIAGADIHAFFLKKLNAENGSCFYMGSSPKTLEKIKGRISVEFPNIKFGCYSPPFKASFNTNENASIVNAINAFKPDVLFVGMTAPKQEKWAFENKNNLHAGIICSIGAVFDFYAGTVQRPNKIWIDLGLEWFGRLLKEPKRMWKRYIYYGVVFCGHLLKVKLKRLFIR